MSNGHRRLLTPVRWYQHLSALQYEALRAAQYPLMRIPMDKPRRRLSTKFAAAYVITDNEKDAVLGPVDLCWLNFVRVKNVLIEANGL